MSAQRVEHSEYKDHLVRILIGDVFNEEVAEIFEVMGEDVALPEPIELEETVAS